MSWCPYEASDNMWTYLDVAVDSMRPVDSYRKALMGWVHDAKGAYISHSSLLHKPIACIAVAQFDNFSQLLVVAGNVSCNASQHKLC